MTILVKASFLLFLTLFLQYACQKKDDDEGRPYEFGFVIEGEQHRHEKKDINGIIQGEFGFITADGIYHVTAYATDENGNFKILSMRNIRLADNPDIQRAGQVTSKQQPPVRAKSEQLRLPPGPSPGPSPVQPAAITERTNVKFTLQPTVKPACGGCGYVTTQKPRPGEKPTLPPLQKIPPFSKPATNAIPQPVASPPSSSLSQVPNQVVPASQGNQNIPGAPNPPLTPPEQYQSPPGVQNQLPGLPPPNEPSVARPGEIGGSIPSISQGPEPNPPSLDARFGGGQENNRPSQTPNLPPSVEKQQYELIDTGSPRPFTHSQKISELREEVNNNIASLEKKVDNLRGGRIQAGPAIPATPSGKLSGVTVSDGAIHVPGNPDIPIRDKFPGMADGLPAGIEESDIKDILYKFNYTVGFHGHYEQGLKNGAKVGGYFVNGRDGISRIVTYVADENGYRPRVRFVRLGLDSDQTPKEETEKNFGLVNFEFVWYPIS